MGDGTRWKIEKHMYEKLFNFGIRKIAKGSPVTRSDSNDQILQLYRRKVMQHLFL